MDMGAGAVHQRREGIYEWYSRAFLVSRSEYPLLTSFYPICKANKRAYAAGYHAFGLYGQDLPFQESTWYLYWSAFVAVGAFYRRSASRRRKDTCGNNRYSLLADDFYPCCHSLLLLAVFRYKGFYPDRCAPNHLNARCLRCIRAMGAFKRWRSR